MHREGGVSELRAPGPTGNLFRDAARKDRIYGAGGVLLEDRGTRYEYDADGNRVRKETPDGAAWRYEWDAAGRLRAVARPDGTKVEFRYDALGRRILKRSAEGEKRWLWDGNSPVHEWTDDVITGSMVYQPGSFTPVAKLARDGESRGIVEDHVGAPVAMFDRDGKAVWQGRLDAYGKLETRPWGVGGWRERAGYDDDDRKDGESAAEADARRGRTECPWRWQGQYEDEETGLYYNRFRYYDPEVGAYVSQDPIGFLGGRELYGYVPDPSTWVDPLGLAKNCHTQQSAASKGARRAPSLPALDSTGKVHGALPRPADLWKYSAEDLAQLKEELAQSVQERIAKTVQLGSDLGHSERQAAEQQLIKSIEKHLLNR